ncbi:MAG: valine--tRNA ligase [Firmicutes bacterium]|nr:valine--tRNA ligase [Bacillota bacterium]
MDKVFTPSSFEDKIYDRWQKNRLFCAKADNSKPPFTIIMPPPNITGKLHIGHALDLSIQDALVRFKRMNGHQVLFMPGTDHASIATEMKIVDALKAEGLTKKSIGRAAFLDKAYLWNDEYGGRIVSQSKRLGLSADWDRSAFTMDKKRKAAVEYVFVKLYDEGLIYRGERMINWCPTCSTAISDAEVEHKETEGSLWYIKYPLLDFFKDHLKRGGEGCMGGKDDGGFAGELAKSFNADSLKAGQYIEIATTRPETMLGDVAVAVSGADTRYKHLIGKDLYLPLAGRKIKIIADSYVEKDFGTGAVKITPSHDPNDFEIGLRHNLPQIKVIGDNGIMNENAGNYQGLTKKQARKKIVEDLKASGFLSKIKDHNHNVGHCYRCDDVVEPSIKKQWFLKMADLAVPAIDAVKSGDINFVPKRFEKIYLHWMQNTRDWCISRQLWWGHRIPIWYCDKCGAEVVVKSECDQSDCKGKGSDKADKKCKCGERLIQDQDVLDTWFSSALWPFSTLDWPTKSADLDYFYPSNVLVTGYDIIGFWVSRMIFSGLKFMGKKPFDTVLIHGIVRDENGKKMSKSSGNGVDPMDAINQCGADALRLSLVAGVGMGSDTKYSVEKLESFRNFLNKLWNASRFVFSACDGDFKKREIDKKLIGQVDKWILFKLNETVKQVTKLMEKFEIGLAATALYEFVWSEFCDWYIEAAKVDLYGDKSAKKQNTIAVLLFVLDTCLKLIHPIAPFITTEIFDSFKTDSGQELMIQQYPKHLKDMAKFKTDAEDFEQIMSLIKGIRNLRSQLNVSQTKRTPIQILPSLGYKNQVLEGAVFVQKLGMGSEVKIIEAEPTGHFATFVGLYAKVFINMGDLIDLEQEKSRLNKELIQVKNEIERAEKMLKNEGFLARAPVSVVEQEKEKIKKFITQKEQIENSIVHLNSVF